MPWQRNPTCRSDPEASFCTPAADEPVCPAGLPADTTSLGRGVRGKPGSHAAKTKYQNHFAKHQNKLTAPPAGCDGGAVVLEVQGAGRVEHRIHEDVRLALLQHVQDLLQVGAAHTHAQDGCRVVRWRHKVLKVTSSSFLRPHGGSTKP